MGERTEYKPGTFCWTDLTTTDQDAAKKFYGGVLGWDYQDNPVDNDTVYSMALVDGKPVCAISPQPPMQRDAGFPPLWNSYVSVDDADAVADQAKELGASVHAPAFDVMDVGRMAVIEDPQGAFFFLWQPKDMKGAALVNEAGALAWNELASPDVDASAKFYGDLFGWTTEKVEGDQVYLMIKNGGASNGGIREKQEPEPPAWTAYFGCDDLDAAAAKIEESGGTKMMGPMDVGMGHIVVATDPQGAIFALFKGEMDS